MRIEVLRTTPCSATATGMLDAMEQAVKDAGDQLTASPNFVGGSELLILFGVGNPANNWARQRQIKNGGHVLMWDLGYFGHRRLDGWLRMSIDHDHPQRFIDRTPDYGRWDAHGIELREDAYSDGHIVLVGLGVKSRQYLKLRNWEQETLQRLRNEHPGRKIVFRPKGADQTSLRGVEVDRREGIEGVLRGASLVVARHSNVCVDAAIAGVPFQCEDGAAMWLSSRPYTRDNRLDFLRRLAWWQWKPSEAGQALQFAKGML